MPLEPVPWPGGCSPQGARGGRAPNPILAPLIPGPFARKRTGERHQRQRLAGFCVPRVSAELSSVPRGSSLLGPGLRWGNPTRQAREAVGLWVSAGSASKMTWFERSFFKLHFARMQSGLCNPPAGVGAGRRVARDRARGHLERRGGCQRLPSGRSVASDGGLTGWLCPSITAGSCPAWASPRTAPGGDALIYLLPRLSPTVGQARTRFRALKAWGCRSLAVWGDLILPAPVLACGVPREEP